MKELKELRAAVNSGKDLEEYLQAVGEKMGPVGITSQMNAPDIPCCPDLNFSFRIADLLKVLEEGSKEYESARELYRSTVLVSERKNYEDDIEAGRNPLFEDINGNPFTQTMIDAIKGYDAKSEYERFKSAFVRFAALTLDGSEDLIAYAKKVTEII